MYSLDKLFNGDEEYDPEIPSMYPSMYSPTVSPRNRPYSPSNPSMITNENAHYQYRGYQGQPKGSVEHRNVNYKRKHIPPSNANNRLRLVRPNRKQKKKKYKKRGVPLKQPKYEDVRPKKRARVSTYKDSFIKVKSFEEQQFNIVNSFRIPHNLTHTRDDFETYNGVCWWDMYPFNGNWVGCPYKMDINEHRIYTEGFFCSYNCAYAYALHENITPLSSVELKGVKPLIALLIRKELMEQGKEFKAEHINFKAAPKSFRMTQMFGGEMSIDEYRKVHCNTLRYLCYPERYTMVPTGIICYVEDLKRPFESFDTLRPKHTKIDYPSGKSLKRKTRPKLEEGEVCFIPEFESKSPPKRVKKNNDDEKELKFSAEVQHRKTRRDMQKSLNTFKRETQKQKKTRKRKKESSNSNSLANQLNTNNNDKVKDMKPKPKPKKRKKVTKEKQSNLDKFICLK